MRRNTERKMFKDALRRLGAATIHLRVQDGYHGRKVIVRCGAQGYHYGPRGFGSKNVTATRVLDEVTCKRCLKLGVL